MTVGNHQVISVCPGVRGADSVGTNQGPDRTSPQVDQWHGQDRGKTEKCLYELSWLFLKQLRGLSRKDPFLLVMTHKGGGPASRLRAISSYLAITPGFLEVTDKAETESVAAF